jgi:integrase
MPLPADAPKAAIDEIVSLAPAALAERMQLLAPYLHRAYAKNTVRVWRSNWRMWCAFCEAVGEEPLPTSVPVLERFLVHGANRGLKRATLEQYLATLATVHDLARLPNPMDSFEGQLMWKALRRERLVKKQRQAAPLTWETIGQITDRLSGIDAADVRDHALIVVAYETLMRRSELAAMNVDHLDFQRDGSCLVFIPFSKTDQEGEGDHRPLSAATAAVLKTWLDRSAINEGAVWRTIPPAWRGEAFVNRIAPDDVARIFKRRALRAGLPADTISGHSTRVGGAQDLIENNFGTAAIMIAGGWKTERMVAKYGRKLSASRNAMAQLQRKRSES